MVAGSGLGQLVFGFEGAGRHVPNLVLVAILFWHLSEAQFWRFLKQRRLNPKPQTPNHKLVYLMLNVLNLQPYTPSPFCPGVFVGNEGRDPPQ